MKITKIWIFAFMIFASPFLLMSGCKKKNDDNSTNNNQIETGTMTDIEGNVYKTVKIGTQWWMAENLKTTKYNDGTSIPLVTEYLDWRYSRDPGYCWFENDSALYKDTYGALYNWYVISTGKLAPTGWHIPSEVEWWTLINYLGGWQIAGGKMKCTGTIEAGTGPWYEPNTGATNESGFSAVPTGAREEGGSFMHNPSYKAAYEADWWAATEEDFNSALECYISYKYAGAGCEPDGLDKCCGLSVRCVRD